MKTTLKILTILLMVLFQSCGCYTAKDIERYKERQEQNTVVSDNNQTLVELPNPCIDGELTTFNYVTGSDNNSTSVKSDGTKVIIESIIKRDTIYKDRIVEKEKTKYVDKISYRTPKWAWYSLIFSIISIFLMVMYLKKKFL